jgi:hypothetical protein
VLSNLAYAAGPNFYWVFLLLPVDTITHQVAADYSLNQDTLERLTGLTAAALAGFTYLMARYGIKGIFTFSRPWRIVAFIAVIIASLFGGFRSIVIIFGLTFAIQFFLEGLFRTRLFPILVASTLALSLLILPNSQRLPRTIQRVFSFLPLELDPLVKADAQASLEWRLEMWRVLMPEVGKHLYRGKGFSINPTDLYLAEESTRRGLSKNYESAIIAGDYHNGPISILIPFGIYGFAVFLWFVIAALWALRRNYLYGEPELKTVNTFLIAYFIMRIVFFFVFFGGFVIELYHLAGLLGLSISLNSGVRKASDAQEATLTPAAIPART